MAALAAAAAALAGARRHTRRRRSPRRAGTRRRRSPRRRHTVGYDYATVVERGEWWRLSASLVGPGGLAPLVVMAYAIPCGRGTVADAVWWTAALHSGGCLGGLAWTRRGGDDVTGAAGAAAGWAAKRATDGAVGAPALVVAVALLAPARPRAPLFAAAALGAASVAWPVVAAVGASGYWRSISAFWALLVTPLAAQGDAAARPRARRRLSRAGRRRRPATPTPRGPATCRSTAPPATTPPAPAPEAAAPRAPRARAPARAPGARRPRRARVPVARGRRPARIVSLHTDTIALAKSRTRLRRLGRYARRELQSNNAYRLQNARSRRASRGAARVIILHPPARHLRLRLRPRPLPRHPGPYYIRRHMRKS